MNELQQIEKILESNFGIYPYNIFAVYPYGSVVYGTNSAQSDRDYVVIADMDASYLQFESEEIDIHIFSLARFKTSLDKCEIMALETYFNTSPIKTDLSLDFELDRVALRHSVSAVVSNSWVKASKKVNLENENSWIGYKSLFHAMRILNFGIQIAETGRITDFRKVSHLWNDILQMVERGDDFDSIMKFYKPIQNANLTIFRQLAPKQ